MSFGPLAVHTVTMASGGTLTAEIDLGRPWNRVYVDPTGALSEVRFKAASSEGGTYRQVYHPSINSATVAANMFKIPSSVSGGMIECPAGLQFIKIETTAAVADGVTFKLVCSSP